MAQAAHTPTTALTHASLKPKLTEHLVGMSFTACTVVLYGLLRLWSLGRRRHLRSRTKALTPVPHQFGPARSKAMAAF